MVEKRAPPFSSSEDLSSIKLDINSKLFWAFDFLTFYSSITPSFFSSILDSWLRMGTKSSILSLIGFDILLKDSELKSASLEISLESSFFFKGFLAFGSSSSFFFKLFKETSCLTYDLTSWIYEISDTDIEKSFSSSTISACFSKIWCFFFCFFSFLLTFNSAYFSYISSKGRMFKC